MAKTLELEFGTEFGKTARISVDNPKEPIDEAQLKLSMEQIIASDVFFTPTGKLAVAKGARVIDRNVVEYEIG
ncbi:DUF2922 domain-containing protein [Neobacillus sedimentimangrovi]|jgi:Protein of unknown function (DUF2922)|uniref:DUF2922 domain-containing protein n=1 Tax=Neobacillus sedimentimangrovi TaxID=2699460 RepID=A0ABS8QH58_9BACI|nr:DUF2922 domain-containing protein [Neobacillus sedimentimangrovi]MCD4838325.1 DUF2922 domain-containing protein [Neobacillus sedimentimangrovi]